MDLTGASALVTGGASGLGLATARRLAAAGAAVTIVDLPTSAGADAAAELGGTFAAADVTDPEQVAAAVQVAAASGPLRVVVNCAGIAPPAKVLDREGNPSPLDGFEQIIRVNLIGTYNVIAQASAVMARTEPSRQRGSRRHRQHRERRGLRRTDRPAGLLGQQGRRARDDAADRPRTRPLRHPGRHDRPGDHGDADARRPAAGGAGLARRAGALPRPARTTRRIRVARARSGRNGYLNGETIRLDGAIRMAPR